MAYRSVKSQLTRRAALFGGGAAVGAYAGARLSSKIPSVVATNSLQPTGAEGTLNDASLLNETPVAKHVILPDNPSGRMIEKVRDEVIEARDAGRPFNIGAARHSMGGHAIPREGTALTYDNGLVEPDRENMIYRVHAGARWRDVIAQLDLFGMSPEVMQSNNDFGVAASFCVNAHGWPVPWGPMGQSVRQVYMLRPDAELLRVSRDEFADLFTLTMGGFGLTGAILELEVEMVANVRLKPTFQKMQSREFAPFFVGAIEAGDVNMAYGQLNVDRESFFEDALMITYRESEDQEDLPSVGTPGFMSETAERISQAQVMNETVKGLRWGFEAGLVPWVGAGEVTRNTLLNQPVGTREGRRPERTDILHEDFV
ncbi:MAG: FAD-binding protein, partial [Paracoccaceae bacterium]